jgi:hypothetical protein
MGTRDLSSPLFAIEETEGCKNDKQHEPHGGDCKEDVQPPGVLFLWWSEGDRGKGKKLKSQRLVSSNMVQ